MIKEKALSLKLNLLLILIINVQSVFGQDRKLVLNFDQCYNIDSVGVLYNGNIKFFHLNKLAYYDSLTIFLNHASNKIEFEKELNIMIYKNGKLMITSLLEEINNCYTVKITLTKLRIRKKFFFRRKRVFLIVNHCGSNNRVEEVVWLTTAQYEKRRLQILNMRNDSERDNKQE